MPVRERRRQRGREGAGDRWTEIEIEGETLPLILEPDRSGSNKMGKDRLSLTAVYYAVLKI